MKIRSRFLMLTALLGFSGTAYAQGALPGNHFTPAPGAEENYIVMDGASVLDHLQPAFGFISNFANEAFVYENAVGDERNLLDERFSTDFMAAIGLLDRVQLGVAMPVHFYTNEDVDSTRTFDGASSGDLRVHGKVRLLGDPERKNGAGLSLAGVLTAPTGDQDDFEGEDNLTIEPRAIVEWNFGDMLRAGANVGYIVREQERLDNIAVDNEIAWKAGLGFSPVPETLEILGELNGKVAVDSDIAAVEANSPLEANGAVRWNIMDTAAITAGGGAALNEGYGTPDWRVFAGLSIAPGRDRIEDCDMDGIADASDACDCVDEDYDGWQDADGCPDNDNDGDGIADANDVCPNSPEDFDNDADGDGCPEATAQPVADCPEPAPVEDIASRLNELCERVFFDYNKAVIKTDAYSTLDEIAMLLQQYPQVERIEIQGHADFRGTEEYNLQLSMARAQAIRDYLVSKGVDDDRLAVRGFGEGDPLVTATSDEGRALNRRVEFDVLSGPAPRCPAPPRLEGGPVRRGARPAGQPEKW